MAGIIYELVDVLEEEKECYEGLNQLADYTKTAVVNKNIEFLKEVIETEEQFVGRLNLLGKKRESLMNDIAIVTGTRSKGITITLIIEKIGKDTEMGIKLAELRDSIKGLLEEIKGKSDFNKQLLSDSLEIVDFMVNAIRGTKGYVQVGNYSKAGEELNVERQQRIFDRTQ